MGLTILGGNDNVEDDTRDIAVEAKTTISSHVLECDKRYRMFCSDLGRLKDANEKDHQLIFESLSNFKDLFNRRWWELVLAAAVVSAGGIIGLLIYIWNTHLP